MRDKASPRAELITFYIYLDNCLFKCLGDTGRTCLLQELILFVVTLFVFSQACVDHEGCPYSHKITGICRLFSHLTCPRIVIREIMCSDLPTYSTAYLTLNGTVFTVSQSSALLALPNTLNPDTANWYVPSGNTVPSAIRPLKKAERYSFGAYGMG